jgi:hypothetical protein
LKIRYPVPSSKVESLPLPSIDWKLQLAVEADINKDESNYLGIAPSAKAGANELNEEKPPLFGDLAYLYFSRPEWDPKYRWFSSDFRPAVGDGQVWDLEVSNPRLSNAKISVIGIHSVPAQYDVLLIDPQNTTPINLRRENEYRYRTTSEKMTFKLVVGKKTFVQQTAEQFIPTDFELLQNFPNPFNPATAITYRVARESHVQLEVVSVLGQHIESLVDQVRRAGTYTVVWNPGGASDRLSSGVYVCRLIVDGKLLSAKKMMLLQ